MLNSKPTNHSQILIKGYSVILLFALIFNAEQTHAQTPNISYTTPQVYTVNTAISPLTPVNTSYSQVAAFAGTGQQGLVNGLRLSAEFNSPGSIAFDNNGNFIIADQVNNAIRMITPAGIVSTVAITQQRPESAAVDSHGNIYVSEYSYIEKIDPSGTQTLFAGDLLATGNVDGLGTNARFNNASAIVIDASDNLYVCDFYNYTIRKITPDGNVTTFAGNGTRGENNGSANVATFNAPFGIAIDAADNLYIADQILIRKITPTGVVSTFAGNEIQKDVDGPAASASISGAFGLTVVSNGDVYVSDSGPSGYPLIANRIRKISNGIVSTLQLYNSSSVTVQTYIDSPTGIIMDKAGNLYVISDNEIQKIAIITYSIDKPLPPGLVFDTGTGIISGTPTQAWPSTDYTITATNSGGSSIAVVNITVIKAVAALPVSPPNIKYQTPQIYTVSTTINPLPPVNTGGAVPATIYGQVITFAGSAAHGSANGNGIAATFNNPTRIAEDANGNVFVADRDNGSVRKITPTGTVTTFAQGYSQPNGLCVDPAGNVFVADAGSNSVEKTTPAGVITNFASGFNSPYDVTIDAAGNLYVADGGDHQIRKISPASIVSTLAGSGAGGNTNGAGNVASFNTPDCVSLDASNNIYVSDPGNNDIRMVTPAGVVSTVAGTPVGGSLNGPVSTATFSGPCGVAKDIPGNIYVADLSNNLIRKIDPTGIVSTLAGSGNPAALDGVGLAASFNRPNDVQVDPNGFLYVDDYGNNIIRKVIITGYTIDKTLPAGLTFDPTTGIISGTPTAASPATNYTVTAYNTGGSSITVVNIKVILAAPALVFGPLSNETQCSPDFAPGATGGTGTYSYSSSNTAVATIINNKIHITGSGITNITVTDGVNTLTQQLTVVEQLTITANIIQTVIANCTGEPNTYMVNYTNGITPTNFQWQVNNQNVGGSTSTFSSNTLKNDNVITCIVTDAAICTTGPATSNSLTVVFKPSVTPSVSIQSSAVGSVAPDTPITFTATPANGGSSPSYQWMINGIAITGANNPTYTNTCLNDGDIVDCTLTNNDATCVITPTVQSNNITIAITAATNPATVTITPSVNNVYAGTPITLTAAVTNTNVINYQWQVNGKDGGNNSSIFSSSTFHNGDKVTCMITSQNNCHTLITSNTVVIELLPPLVLTIPNTFTPNGDGINDLWEIPGLAFYPNCEVTVYNRYGSLVYKSKGYSKSWDGNYNGAPLPSSTYYYIIDPGNKNPKVSGYVLILR